jgi:colanic acid/amylovoran biosynthesis glycosyltransferase
MWEGKQIYRFKFSRLLSLFFWIPYWSWRKPRAFKEILNELLKKPCPSLQNWNETFLALGFALVEASNFKVKNYSLIHGIWATMPATATLALSKLIDVPFSMGAHAYDVFRTGGDWLLELKFRNAVFIRTSSQSTVRRIEQVGVSSGKIKLIRRGLTSWPVRENFLMIDHSRLELLSVGRLVEKKGYIHQLQIAASLLEQSIPFRLRIVGSGPLKKFLLKEINRLGLIENVIFLGSKSQKETREVYLNSDVFIFTGIIAKDGDRDGIPNVIPEAMSAGCLILASSHAGASEAFIDDVSGFSLNPKDTQKWVSILKEFWEEPGSFQLMRKRAVKHTRQAFDVLQTAHSFHSVIEQNLDL